MTATDTSIDLKALDYDAIARRERRQHSPNRAVAALMILLSLLWLAPFYYLVVSVLKSPEEYAAKPPLALPDGIWPLWANLSEAWTTAKMGYGLMNSMLYGTVGAVLAVFIATMAAHGLSRFQFRGRTFWFMLLFSGTVFPFQMYLIPLFFSYLKLGLLDTRFGMILFYTAICIPFPVLVMKSFLSQMSTEMDEAARMDGCSELRLFFSIVLPNCAGPFVALFLLQFTWIWNDLIFSTVLTQSAEVRSVMSTLQVFQGAYAKSSQTVVMAASLLASIPTVVLFFALRKHFMQGFQAKGL
ncbi:carbohydrate ABC transporter permease [Mameliella sediminis]|uniref:carbohydrate ABC transporter permease n=1 Tax=Mameliella sediminis TaxID=2836866 RepID=UPI001C47AEC1|nr:carbohydrate ABC transporter permease [Mameliella sediminis]MBY6115558.1 carbohydrate ABC transporter permease [Antarctobacter heliothermus]MBY6145805.1 carbohydrate ABC transporter permease [Mameliella alba]MBV7393473.1 carbohydrate ABC transporter permease [Mameliella sediminis]MBY6161127.1 carbohydrate ABC transporter permease [Mameliella alba]MBY6169597.1 carbohydrate ABC transporter permease [Mameliella alba]